jgi:phosphoesterase RecJ-like protein
MPTDFPAASRMIREAQSIILSTHEKPDADGIGSMLALESALLKLNKQAISFSPLALPKILNFLPGRERIKQQLSEQELKADLIIGLDYGSLKRLEVRQSYPFLGCPILTFDHHLPDNDTPGKELKIINSGQSSTAEIIYDFLNFLEVAIEKEIATCLLAGIIDDTGAFCHPSTTATTLKIAGQLMTRGARWQKILALQKQEPPKAKALAINRTFANMEIDKETGLVFSFIDHRLLSQSIDSFQELQIAGLLGNIPEAKISLSLIEKTPGIIDVSLRSQKDRNINVAKIAQRFGGGGHKLAAGFKSESTKEEIIKRIKEIMRE